MLLYFIVKYTCVCVCTGLGESTFPRLENPGSAPEYILTTLILTKLQDGHKET